MVPKLPNMAPKWAQNDPKQHVKTIKRWMQKRYENVGGGRRPVKIDRFAQEARGTYKYIHIFSLLCSYHVLQYV